MLEQLLQYKKCACPAEYFEGIIVDRDENFDMRTTAYYHCDDCGEDFRIIDLDTEEILFEKDTNARK